MKITLIGMFNATLGTLFDDMYLPAGVDEDIMISTLLREKGEFPSLYGDPTYLKKEIGAWSQANKQVFDRLWSMWTAEYNPIENYDRKEESSTKGKTSTKADSETIDYRSAFDTANWSRTDRGTAANSGSGTSDTDYEARIHGNIGVTTTAQMIRGELDLYDNWNFYGRVTDMFAGAFLLGIY